jgi:hypothetical protein
MNSVQTYAIYEVAYGIPLARMLAIPHFHTWIGFRLQG